LWFGFYSNNVGFIKIENNIIHDNEVYGLDPHTGSHDLTIRNNTIYNIRDGIGIICSLDCKNILIEKNKVSTSKNAGIMLSKNVVNSVIKDNVVFNQTIGISISDSSNNFIMNNTIFDVDYGIQVKVLRPDTYSASDNKIIGNTITNVTKIPIFINEFSSRNTIFQNTFDVSNETAIILDPNVGPGNLVADNYFINEPEIISEPELDTPKIEDKNEPEKNILKVALVDNSFTRTAQQPDSFSSFFSKYKNSNQTFVSSDHNLLKSMITNTTSPMILSFKNHLETILPISEISILRDEDIHQKVIFDEKGYRLFDVLILFNEEYVTQQAYNHFKSFVVKGGTIIFLDGGVFVAEVIYDEQDNSLQFKKGKNWKFDGTLVEKSEWERYLAKNQEWVGSNTLLEDDGKSLYLLNLPFNYEHVRGSFVSNPDAKIWHDFGAISLENLTDENISAPKIAIYEMNFGRGQVIMLGISTNSIIENKVFLNFFDNFIFPKVMGDKYEMEQFEKDEDLAIHWVLDSGNISSTKVDLKLKAITFNLERSSEINDKLRLVLPLNLLLITKAEAAESKIFVDDMPVNSTPILTDVGTGFEIPLQADSTKVQIIGEQMGFFDSDPPNIVLNKIDFSFEEDLQRIFVEGSASDKDSGVYKVDLFLEKIPSGEILTFNHDSTDFSDWSSWKMETLFDGGTDFKIIATAADYLNNRVWTESEVFESFTFEDGQFIDNSLEESKKTKSDSTEDDSLTELPQVFITQPTICRPLTQVGDIIVEGTASDNIGIAKVEAFAHTLPFDGNFNFQSATQTNQGDWSKWFIEIPIADEKPHRILVRVTDMNGNANWDDTMVNYQLKKLQFDFEEYQNNPHHAFLFPTFTSGAYNLDSFYFFYSKYARALSSDEITDDLHLLTGELPHVYDVEFFKPLVDKVEEFDPDSIVSIITDNDVHNGLIFEENGDNKYKTLFVLHDEYVTQESYDNLQQFVKNGGVIVFLDANIFYAEVLLDEVNCTVTLVKGHDWEFDGSVAKKSVSERYLDENKQWMGSNFIVNALEDKVTFENNPFNYTHFEENQITNPNATILLDYNAKFLDSIEDENMRVATYELSYGKGKVIMMGIYAEKLSNNQEFQEFFEKIILPRALEKSYTISYEDKKFDLYWKMQSGNVTKVELDKEEKSITMDLEINDEEKLGLDGNNLLVMIPKLLLDAPTETRQAEFIVFVDDKQVDYTQASDDIERSIEIPVSIDSVEVEIFGTLVLGEIQTTLPSTSEEIKQSDQTTSNVTLGQEDSNEGGCLIATAAYGSEMAPQVQLLREIRDGKLMTTSSGAAFMTGFNQFYYSFSPYIADYERENSVFKEMVKIAITPLLSSLSLLKYVEMESESQVLGYGISLILLNLGIYFIAPAMFVVGIRKRF